MGYVCERLAEDVPLACFAKWSLMKKGVSTAKAADTPDLVELMLSVAEHDLEGVCEVEG